MMFYQQKAKNAYKVALDNTGVIQPKRVAIGSRIIDEVRGAFVTFEGNGSKMLHQVADATNFCGVINAQNRVGGFQKLENKPSTKETGHDGMPLVGLVMKSLEAEFFQNMKKGAIEYVQQRGDLQLIPVGTHSQTEIDKQIQLVDELVRMGVNAMVVIPIDSKALVPSVVNAVKAGVKVVNIDILLDPDLLKEQGIDLVFVGPDNETAAKTVGDVLAKELGSHAKVIVIEGVPAAMNAQQRKQGFLKSIQQHGLNLLDTGVANWETEQAFNVFSTLLQQHPDVQGVMCANDAMALGVIDALRSDGKAGLVKVIGFDNDDAVRPLIANGHMLATMDCFGSQMAADGIDYAMRALKGEKHKGWIKTKMNLITRSTLL